MTVKMVATINRWEGLSTDDKPSSGVRVGSTFKEVDTGKKFIYHNADWKEDISEPLSTARAIELNAELRRLVEATYLETRAANLANGIEVA